MSTDTTALDAARTTLGQALQGRTASTRDLLDLDVAQFVVGDAVHASKIAAWVEAHSRPKPAGDEIPSRYRPAPQSDGQDPGIAEAERRFGPKN